MKTVVYADILLAVNLLITYILLLLTCVVLKVYVRKSRLLLGSLLGAVYSLAILIPTLDFVLSLLLKFFMCVSIVCVTFRLKNFRLMLRFCICFFLVNISLAGLFLVLQNLLSFSSIYVRNVNVYFNVDIPMLLVISAAAYLLLKFGFKLFQRSNNEDVFLVRIGIDSLYVEVPAIIDTGNSLKDPMQGKSVCIVSFDTIERMLPNGVKMYLKGCFDDVNGIESQWKKRLSVVYADFAVGDCVMPTIRVDYLDIIHERFCAKYENCIVAVTQTAFKDAEYQMLLHPYFADENNCLQEDLHDKNFKTPFRN